MTVPARLRALAATALGTNTSLAQRAQARLGQPVHAATILDVDARRLDAILPRRSRQQILLAVTDDYVHLIDCQRRTGPPALRGVLASHPRDELVATWQRRRLDIKAELSWPTRSAYLAGTTRLGADSDRVIGLLIASELDRLDAT